MHTLFPVFATFAVWEEYIQPSTVYYKQTIPKFRSLSCIHIFFLPNFLQILPESVAGESPKPGQWKETPFRFIWPSLETLGTLCFAKAFHSASRSEEIQVSRVFYV